MKNVINVTVPDIDRLELTCKHCGYGIILPMKASSQESMPYRLEEQAAYPHCKKHWWCPRTANGDEAINPHLPPLIRALGATTETTDLKLTMVSVSEKE